MQQDRQYNPRQQHPAGHQSKVNLPGIQALT